MTKTPDTDKPSDQLTISSDLVNLPKVETFCLNICEKAGLTEDQSNNMAIAMTELVNNAILHGNQNDVNKSVYVGVTYFEDCVKVCVKDEGEGFDPTQIANPTDPENLWKLGGRGVFLVRNLIDEVEIVSSDKGTEVQITEYLAK